MKKNMQKAAALLLLMLTVCTCFVGCGRGANNGNDGKTELEVAVLESAYGDDMWEEICRAFEETHENVTVTLTAEKNLEDVIGAQMKTGDYPDVVHLATGREAGLTETMIKEGLLTDLSSMLKKTVPGENVTVEEKLIPGFTDTLATNPYGDGKTYLAPMFYAPCGLFYNADLFRDKGWKVPETWEEMFALGDTAAAEGISLFTYPTAGYFDAFFYALLAESGGIDFYNRCMKYEEGIWNTEEARDAFELVARLGKYTEPTTVANANNDNYLKNQQLILEGKALFMPNGTWVVGEMADAPRREGFEWGLMALPAVEGGERCSFTFFEQCWIPKEAKNKELAEEFIAFLYSDKAADIFAKSGAVQPIKGLTDNLEGENATFYAIYENGATAVMGGFAATEPVAGVSMADSLFETINSVVSGKKTVDQWQAEVAAASDKLRPHLK